MKSTRCTQTSKQPASGFGKDGVHSPAVHWASRWLFLPAVSEQCFESGCLSVIRRYGLPAPKLLRAVVSRGWTLQNRTMPFFIFRV